MKFRFYFLLAILIFASTASIISSASQSTPATATPAAQVTPITQVTSAPQTTQAPAEIVKRYKIAFISYRDKKPALFVMNEDGSNQTRIVNEPVIDAPPLWSPDGTRIMYLKNNGKLTEIWAVQPDGSNPVRLSSDCFYNGAEYQNRPSWSPDGTKVLFVSNREGRLGIFMVGADGNNELRLTAVDTRGSSPSWAPDGNQILCLLKTGDDQGIYLLNPDGTVNLKLTEEKGTYSLPTWAPDGKKIAYIYQKSFSLLTGQQKGGLSVMSADGSNKTQLADNAGSITWSPDCKSIIFTSLIKSGIDERSESNLLMNILQNNNSKKDKKLTSIYGTYMVSALEGKPVLLVTTETSRYVPQNADQSRLSMELRSLELDAKRVNPGWSADGKAIAYINNTELIVHLFTDGKTNKVGLPYPCNEQPVWSPDGNKIAYINFSGLFSKSSIFIMDGTGKTTKITNNTLDMKPVWSPVALP